MNENLMNFKLILEHADLMLKEASQAQNSNPIDYDKAKETYVKAYYMYIDTMNDFCSRHQTTIKFDLFCHTNKYDQPLIEWNKDGNN
jgi:hypothetical protein